MAFRDLREFIGALESLLIVMKGLPLAYQKDLQEDKEGAMDAFAALKLSIGAMTGMVRDMTPDVARKVVEYFQALGDVPGMEHLTHREREVLDGLAQGWLYKEIADRLGVSVETARKHLKNIYRKLQVSSRTEAVVKYLRSKS